MFSASWTRLFKQALRARRTNSFGPSLEGLEERQLPTVSITNLYLTPQPSESAGPATQIQVDYHDDNRAEAFDLFCAVDYGDATPGESQGADTSNYNPLTGNGAFVFQHAYGDEGPFLIAVSARDGSGNWDYSSIQISIADSDGTMRATASDLSVTEGSRYTGKLATFTTENPIGTADGYNAQINWGDNTVSAGTVMGRNGSFDVSDSHIYREAGIYTVKVTFKDNGTDNAATATSQAFVSDAPLTAACYTIHATEYQTFSGSIGSFQDENVYTYGDDMTATINWGDGNSSAGTIEDDQFVSGSHTYNDEGQYTITLTIQDQEGSTAQASGVAQVAEGDAFRGSGLDITAPEGTAFTGTVATFRSALRGAGTPADSSDAFTATVDWGDGTVTPGTFTHNRYTFDYTVTGTHTYAREGSYHVTANVLEDGSSNVGSAGSTATVQNADVLTTTGATLMEAAGVPFSAVPVATFTDTYTSAVASEFTASINWGDNTASAGTVAGSAGHFTVTGGHVYANEGRYATTVSIVEGGSTSTATGMVHVARVGPPPTRLGELAVSLTHLEAYYSNFVTAAYQKYLTRQPDAAGLHAWVVVMQGGLSDEQLEAGFIGSAEYIANHGGSANAYHGWIKGMYQDLLGRTPGEAEIQAWQTFLATGGSPYQVAYGFAASSEREGNRIRADYQKYLGRLPGQDEVKAWVDAFANHGVSNENVIAGFVASAEYFQKHYDNVQDWIFSAYEDILGRDPSAFDYYHALGFLTAA